MCESNQEPKFLLAESTGITSTSLTLILLKDTLDNCLLVPIIKNSVLSSFNINLSLIIHERTSAIQFSITSSATASLVLSNGRNDKYNGVSSAYECADRRWGLNLQVRFKPEDDRRADETSFKKQTVVFFLKLITSKLELIILGFG